LAKQPERRLDPVDTEPYGDGEVPDAPVVIFRRLAAGDESALVDLFHEFGDALFSLACRMLDDSSEAEEVLQDYLLVAWRRAAKFDPSISKPFTYSVSIVRKLCIDRIRRRTAAKRSAKIVPIETAFVEPEANADVLGRVAFRERRRRVRRALDRLPPAERRCVEMAVFGELTHSEIAAQANEPLGTVKSRVRRGMIKLRTLLRRKDDDR
jgi:RNA polymerase sigma-70 factor (ECF subfamily)